jgi:predicted Fe-Mo cluster-binding NifX family protein
MLKQLYVLLKGAQMKVVVSANGAGLEAQASPIFGRCPTYVFVDTETMAVESLENSAANAAGGAGIQAAQLVVERGAQAVISGNLGPNAYDVFQAAGVSCYLFGGGTVGEAVQALKDGKLSSVGGANVAAHAGMGGRGGGRGIRGGMGAVKGTNAVPTVPVVSARAEEVAKLKKLAGDLRKQLAEVIERLDRLERER